MESSTPIIDIHVHSTLKPYGNSFYTNNDTKLINSPACIWYKDRYSDIDKIFENTTGISRYRQSDFSTLVEGQCKIICLSQYPIEKEFFVIRKSFLNNFNKWIGQFASLFGKYRISNVMSPEFNYFDDLCSEYLFLKSIDNKTPSGGSMFYKLTSSHDDLSVPANLHVIITIEGAHSFCNGSDTMNPNNWTSLEQNVSIVKSWDAPPFFVTFAHHFYNGLCTHARSLFGTSGELLNQEYGMRDVHFIPIDKELPINKRGENVIDLLLSKKNGRRILIDVKHMSLDARKHYYRLLRTIYKDEKIPVIWSHGAVNTENEEINMCLDVDVKIIYETEGLIGIEIDQRILAYNNKRFIKWFRSIFRNSNNKAFYDAGYFWNQIITIAEYAYDNGFKDNPWKCLSLGSDFDGVINPLNSYRDATKIPNLYNFLIVYLENYWKQSNHKIEKVENLNANDIIYAIMYKNAYDFIKSQYLV